jgi:hypothetical protein
VKVEGADTVLSNCRGPLEDEFVSTACVPGDAVTKGKDTLLTRCSPIPPDNYVSLACKAGDPYHEGQDLVARPCSDPKPGTYVVQICVTGSTKSKGSDTKTKVCSKVINPSSQKITKDCVSGSAYALGSDAVIVSTCTVGFIQDDQYRCTPCTDHKSTPDIGSSTCSVCEQGYYQLAASDGSMACEACPAGGFFTGYFTYPEPLQGYHPSDGDGNGDFVRCTPPESCRVRLGGGSDYCSEGYGGEYCRLCFGESGGGEGFYRVNSLCVQCPSALFVSSMVALFVVVVALITVGMVWVKLNPRFLIAALNFLQIVSTISDLNLKWTPASQVALMLSSPFNLNLQGLALECVSGFSFQSVWILQQSLPLVYLPLLVVYHVVKIMVAKPSHNQSANSLVDTMKAVFLSYFQSLPVFFLMVVNNTLKVRDCTESRGGSVLSSQPSIHCEGSDPVYRHLSPISVLSIVFCVVGIPLAVLGLSFYGHRKHLNPTRRSPSAPPPPSSAGSTSPSLCDLYMEGLYRVYKPEYWYWGVVDLVKKLLIVVAKNAVSSDWPLTQGSSMLVVLVLLALFQHRKSPYVEGDGRGKEAKLLVSLDHFSLIGGVLIIIFGLAMTALSDGSESISEGMLTGCVVMILSAIIGACLYCSFKYRSRKGLVEVAGMVETRDYTRPVNVGGGEGKGGLVGWRSSDDDVVARLLQQLQRYTEQEEAILEAMGLGHDVSKEDLSGLWRELISSGDPLVVEAMLREVADCSPLLEELGALTDSIEVLEAGGLRRRWV